MSEPTVAVILVAAGSGTRLGAAEPKAFVTVAGRTILEHSLESILGMESPVHVVVVAPASEVERARELVHRAAGPVADLVAVVAGGDTRQQSVAAGLAALETGVDIVLVHDAARAFTPAAQLDAVAAGVARTGSGVVPGLPVADTIKQVDWMGAVERTVDRSSLVAVQTPQGFPRELLQSAYAQATQDYTDDAALFAAAGNPVTVVDGDPLAFKITTPWDLRRAESLAGSREAASSATALAVRTGVGIDVHAIDTAVPLWLGGLHWPDEPGLAGHSDGDAVSHALCDALLSAAGLGDIGSRFGTADPRFEGTHGDVFITATVALLAAEGFEIGNVAVQIMANRPKLSPRRALIEARLSGLVGAPVTVSATTTDGLGFAGRGEGVAVIATALITAAR